MDKSKINNLNWAKLLTTGIGDDSVFLNESMAKNQSLLDFTSLCWLELSKEFTQDSPAIFTEYINHDGELNRNFIFNNEDSLKQIRWKHFLADCEPLIADFINVTERVEQEVTKAEIYLQEAHEDIMKNFDPNVVKLKKKMKVVVAPGAFDGLPGEDTD